MWLVWTNEVRAETSRLVAITFNEQLAKTLMGAIRREIQLSSAVWITERNDVDLGQLLEQHDAVHSQASSQLPSQLFSQLFSQLSSQSPDPKHTSSGEQSEGIC